jgi:hypothetical protein
MTYQNAPDEPEDHRPYGYMERQLIFKLLASHAMVDAEFFRALKDDPESAAAQLHIQLTERDVDYIKNSVDWSAIEPHAEDIRVALKLELVTNSW